MHGFCRERNGQKKTYSQREHSFNIWWCFDLNYLFYWMKRIFECIFFLLFIRVQCSVFSSNIAATSYHKIFKSILFNISCLLPFVCQSSSFDINNKWSADFVVFVFFCKFYCCYARKPVVGWLEWCYLLSHCKRIFWRRKMISWFNCWCVVKMAHFNGQVKIK